MLDTLDMSMAPSLRLSGSIGILVLHLLVETGRGKESGWQGCTKVSTRCGFSPSATFNVKITPSLSAGDTESLETEYVLQKKPCQVVPQASPTRSRPASPSHMRRMPCAVLTEDTFTKGLHCKSGWISMLLPGGPWYRSLGQREGRPAEHEKSFT